MISFLEGKIVDKEGDSIVIDVNGVGYEVLVSSHTLNSIQYDNERIKILTYMQVKEDGICLFGFISKEEKNMFLKLINVSGIGPKTAIGILSGISLSDLVKAIVTQDVKMLCTIKGLGKKSAERLLVELKDQDMPDANASVEENVNLDYVEQATDALISLGVSRNEAYRLAKEYAK